MKKKIALFTCLINFIPMVNINFANAMDKSKIATNISGDELRVLNEFKQGNWKVIKEYETGSYSSNVYRVKRDNDTVDYILKVLKQGDEQSFGCEKLACDKFKSYLQEKDDKTILENICPPLDYKSINKNYYVIYEAADSNIDEAKIVNDINNLPPNEKIRLFNDLLFQMIDALKRMNELKLLHVDPHEDNWAIFICKENNKFKLKVKLIDFGETMDISKLNQHSKPTYYPADSSRPEDPALYRDIYLFFKTLDKYLHYFGGNIGDNSTFQNRIERLYGLINDCKGPIKLNQHTSFLDTLWSLLRMPEYGFDKRITKNSIRKTNKDKQSFISIWPCWPWPDVSQCSIY